MSTPMTLQTERLTLRPWRDADLAPFAALNADPVVMEHFPSAMTSAESDAFASRIRSFMSDNGWGLWAVDAPDLGFIGFVGLSVPRFEAAFTPCVEIGWRLSTTAWGLGYATEAARAAADFGFEEVGLSEIVSFATVGNERSQRVMRRLGMTHDPADDWLHPELPEDHPLRPHVLYRLGARMPVDQRERSDPRIERLGQICVAIVGWRKPFAGRVRERPSASRTETTPLGELPFQTPRVTTPPVAALVWQSHHRDRTPGRWTAPRSHSWPVEAANTHHECDLTLADRPILRPQREPEPTVVRSRRTTRVASEPQAAQHDLGQRPDPDGNQINLFAHLP